MVKRQRNKRPEPELTEAQKRYYCDPRWADATKTISGRRPNFELCNKIVQEIMYDHGIIFRPKKRRRRNAKEKAMAVLT